MTDITLKLDADALREATHQALMGLLTPEARTALLEKALADMLKPNEHTKRSPLQQAFDSAVSKIVEQMAEQLIANDQAVKDRLAVLAREAAERMVNADPAELAQKMSAAFVASIRDRY